jgi:hypothetical protein
MRNEAAKQAARAKPFARRLNVTDEQYYADPCVVPSLSQSIAHTLVSQSPLHAWTEHPRLGGLRALPSRAMDHGQLVHKLLLGKGADVTVIECDNYRTKAAQQIRDGALEEGKLPMLAREYEGILKACDVIRTNLANHGIVLNGESEFAIEWDERGAEGMVRCRGKMDHVLLDRGVIYDVKKIRSAHPRQCARSAIEHGYDIQHAAYTSAIGKLRPELEGRLDFLFLFIEIEPPYAVLPARPDGGMRELGSMKWNRAVCTWERCLRESHWPGYSQEIVRLEAPAWAVTEEIGANSDGN